jgi:hypothetical protein
MLTLAAVSMAVRHERKLVVNSFAPAAASKSRLIGVGAASVGDTHLRVNAEDAARTD